MVGDALVQEIWEVLGWWLAYLALVLLGLFLGWAARRLSGHRLRTFWEALLAAVLLFAVPALVRGAEHLAPVGDRFSFAGSRYVVAPMPLMVVMALIALEEPIAGRRVGRWARRVAPIVAILLALSGFPSPQSPVPGSAVVRQCGRSRRTVQGREPQGADPRGSP